MTELNSKHQTVIQALLSRGPLKEDHFHSLFTALTGKTPGSDRQKFDDFLLKINKALSYVQFELRGCRNQYDGQVYYGVVNNVSDEESKLGTKYSVAQIAFYKAIIEAIVQDAAAQGTISNIDALNLRLENQVLMGSMSQSEGGLPHVPPALKNFSISQKEKTLDELVRDQWLSLTPDNYIGLGIRSFLDLRSWFRNNEVPPCEVCNEAGVKVGLKFQKLHHFFSIAKLFIPLHYYSAFFPFISILFLALGYRVTRVKIELHNKIMGHGILMLLNKLTTLIC